MPGRSSRSSEIQTRPTSALWMKQPNAVRHFLMKSFRQSGIALKGSLPGCRNRRVMLIPIPTTPRSATSRKITPMLGRLRCWPRFSGMNSGTLLPLTISAMWITTGRKPNPEPRQWLMNLPGDSWKKPMWKS